MEFEGSTEICVSGCEADVGLGGVIGHSTHEEDGPVTWEALVSPQLSIGEAERRSMTPSSVVAGAGSSSETKSTCTVEGVFASASGASRRRVQGSRRAE